MKTTFGPGVIVTSKWLNGAKRIHFDGLDLDWHFQPISGQDIQRGGTDGLDNLYVTTTTDQEYGSTRGVVGNKSFMGRVEFGNTQNFSGTLAPRSYNTNAKFNIGGSGQNFNKKFANLEDADIITKHVLAERIDNLPAIDQGYF